MVSRPYLSAAAFCAASVVFLVPSVSSACSVCQCGDPLFTSSGASSQTSGTFSFFLDGQFSTKSSGVLADDPAELPEPGDRERSFDRDLTLYASWTPAPRFTVTASVPLRWITITHDPAQGESLDHHNHGFGDASLYLTSVLWQDLETKPVSWLELRVMLKLPSGQSQKTIAGEEDPHIQLGTGSWDFGAGGGGGHHFSHFSLYANGFYRWNQKGSLHYRYGDVFLANLIATSEAFPSFGGVLVRPGAELNFRYAGRDQFHGSAYQDSGGGIAYLTPVLEIPLTRDAEQLAPWLRFAVRMPLGDSNLSGHQHEGFVYNAGIGFAF
ncbi:MAG TPA: hypothetical protein VKF60_00040 [Myxococcota bacterium]|nr:hypothetical protein [Myxococcota bacterium]